LKGDQFLQLKKDTGAFILQKESQICQKTALILQEF